MIELREEFSKVIVAFSQERSGSIFPLAEYRFVAESQLIFCHAFFLRLELLEPVHAASCCLCEAP